MKDLVDIIEMTPAIQTLPCPDEIDEGFALGPSLKSQEVNPCLQKVTRNPLLLWTR